MRTIVEPSSSRKAFRTPQESANSTNFPVRHLSFVPCLSHMQAIHNPALRDLVQMKHNHSHEALFMEHIHQTAASRCKKNGYPAAPWLRQILVIAAFIGFGLASECLAFTVSP